MDGVNTAAEAFTAEFVSDLQQLAEGASGVGEVGDEGGKKNNENKNG